MGMITIDLGRLTATLAGAMPHRPDVTRAVRGLGAAAVQKWKSLAQKELRATSRDYIAGIQVNYDKDRAIITLEGVLPNMIERGWSGGDMRDWLLTSPKAKQGKNGKYLAIPFRHGSAGSSGRNVGPAMPKSIHEVAKRLAPTISRPGGLTHHAGGGHTAWGERLHPGLPMKQAARKILQRKEKPWHASSIYMGMVRKEKQYAKAKQSSYTTFRTISTHSNEPGKHWIHPGIKARRFAPRVQKHVEKIASRIVAAAIGSSR